VEKIQHSVSGARWAGGRVCGEDVGGWGGGVELEAAEKGEGEGEVGEEVGGEGLEGGGVVVDLGEGGGHCGRRIKGRKIEVSTDFS
jgi:hypothetical protein